MTNESANQLSHAFRWALESNADPSTASANWLAREIDERHSTAVGLLADATSQLNVIRKAKDAFKTMRVTGETPGDRRLAARLYLGAIAAAIVFHGVRISGQSADSVIGHLEDMIDDREAPAELRVLARDARGRLETREWMSLPVA